MTLNVQSGHDMVISGLAGVCVSASSSPAINSSLGLVVIYLSAKSSAKIFTDLLFTMSVAINASVDVAIPSFL